MKEKFAYPFPRLVTTSMTAVAVASIMGVSALGLTTPGPVHADHNSMYIVCPTRSRRATQVRLESADRVTRSSRPRSLLTTVITLPIPTTMRSIMDSLSNLIRQKAIRPCG